jgi:hypothetical protein
MFAKDEKKSKSLNFKNNAFCSQKLLPWNLWPQSNDIHKWSHFFNPPMWCRYIITFDTLYNVCRGGSSLYTYMTQRDKVIVGGCVYGTYWLSENQPISDWK